MTRRKTWLAGALVGAWAALAAPQTLAAEVTLKAISAWPKTFPFVSESFLPFIERANEAGKGEFRLTYIGGPEISKAPAQPEGFKAGLFDVMFTAMSYHRGIIPEVDALSGNTTAPWIARANGGLAALNEAVSAKINGTVLVWNAGVSFNLYLRKEPKMRSDGLVDLTGLKMRSVPTYDAFLKALGATTVTIQLPEIHSALQRGIVDGFAFPELWTRRFGYAKFIKYRIYPNFMQLDTVIAINNDAFNKLSRKGRDTLSLVATRFEIDDYFSWKPKIAKEREILNGEFGQKEVHLDAAAGEKYRALANKLVQDRLAGLGTPLSKKLGRLYHGRE